MIESEIITLGESSSRQNREPEASPGQKEVILSLAPFSI